MRMHSDIVVHLYKVEIHLHVVQACVYSECISPSIIRTWPNKSEMVAKEETRKSKQNANYLQRKEMLTT